MRWILTKWYNSFADWVLVSGFLFFNPLNIWFKRSGWAEGATEAIVWTRACSSYQSCSVSPSSGIGVFVIDGKPMTNQIGMSLSAWWSSSMIPPLGLNFSWLEEVLGSIPGQALFITYVIVWLYSQHAQPQCIPNSLVSAASLPWLIAVNWHFTRFNCCKSRSSLKLVLILRQKSSQ